MASVIDVDEEACEAGISLGFMHHVLGFHLWLAQSIFERDLTPRLALHDLTPRQCALLELIVANRGISQVALSRLLGTDRATMMGIVDRLEGNGYIERRRSLSDRRKQELHLTDHGRSVLTLAEARMDENEAHFATLFSHGEREQLVALLRRVHAGTEPLYSPK